MPGETHAQRRRRRELGRVIGLGAREVRSSAFVRRSLSQIPRLHVSSRRRRPSQTSPIITYQRRTTGRQHRPLHRRSPGPLLLAIIYLYIPDIRRIRRMDLTGGLGLRRPSGRVSNGQRHADSTPETGRDGPGRPRAASPRRRGRPPPPPPPSTTTTKLSVRADRTKRTWRLSRSTTRSRPPSSKFMCQLAPRFFRR